MDANQQPSPPPSRLTRPTSISPPFVGAQGGGYHSFPFTTLESARSKPDFCYTRPSYVFGDKPLDRRLNFSEPVTGRSRLSSIPPSRFATSTGTVLNTPLDYEVNTGPRGAYDPLEDTIPRSSFAPQPTPLPSRPRSSAFCSSSRHQTYDFGSDEEVRERVPLLKPGQFDGKGSWPEFLQRFLICADTNRWSESSKARMLLNSLVGEAGAVVFRNPAVRTWSFDQIVDQVSDIFGPTKDHFLLQTERLERRKRRKGEALHVLRDDIIELVSYAYAGTSEDAMQAIAVEKFIRALDNPKIVHRLAELRPATIDAAYEAAKREEANWHMACSVTQGAKEIARGGSQRAVYADEQDDLRAEVRQLASAVAQLHTTAEKSFERLSMADSAKSPSAPAPTLAGRPKKKGSCHNCGQEGHWANECPQLEGRPGGRGGHGGGGGHRSARGRGGQYRRGKLICRRCLQEGHRSDVCPAPAPVRKGDKGGDAPTQESSN